MRPLSTRLPAVSFRFVPWRPRRRPSANHLARRALPPTFILSFWIEISFIFFSKRVLQSSHGAHQSNGFVLQKHTAAFKFESKMVFVREVDVPPPHRGWTVSYASVGKDLLGGAPLEPSSLLDFPRSKCRNTNLFCCTEGHSRPCALLTILSRFSKTLRCFSSSVSSTATTPDYVARFNPSSQ